MRQKKKVFSALSLEWKMGGNKKKYTLCVSLQKSSDQSQSNVFSLFLRMTNTNNTSELLMVSVWSFELMRVHQLLHYLARTLIHLPIILTNTQSINLSIVSTACIAGLTPSTRWYGPAGSSRSSSTPLRAQVKVRSMVGSWEAWHCSVTFSPWLMSALEGASVIFVASAWIRHKMDQTSQKTKDKMRKVDGPDRSAVFLQSIRHILSCQEQYS